MNSLIHVALVTPHYSPVTRGNAVTVRRIEKHLSRLGLRVTVLSLESHSTGEIRRRIASERPDLVHAFHASKGAPVAAESAVNAGIPYVVTFTGTDAYEGLEGEERGIIGEVCGGAAAATVFHVSVAERIAFVFPSLAEKTTVVPQGVELPGEECPGAGFPVSAGKIYFLLPAGLRPVKNVLFPLEPLARLAERDRRIRFVLAGPVVDPAYAAQVITALERYDFAHYVGGVGHDSMGCLYRKSDIVLNTSLSEGGMANSVLEAMAFGKPVLASDIDGNRSLVEDGVTGLLYSHPDDFERKAEKLVAEGALRRSLGEAGKRFVLENFSPEREAEAYREVYLEAVRSKK